MSKRIKWWWVVATHKSRKISGEECDTLGMCDFFNCNAAARVFTSLHSAVEWINERKRLNAIPEEITLNIISDESWDLVKIIYYKGVNYRQEQL